ncbi:signal recognition particle 72 [Oratosquilla oratoria]|uniref:signal recognition particle 72 n=1 Tax=Oratosquilla oratoria TaxID=337810 RepID=UPI003F775FFE
MAVSREARLQGYYTELKKLVDNANYPKVIRAANRIIAEADEELKAWQCKIVAQIHQDQFADALATCNKAVKCTEALAYEKAYCLYRLNKVEDAWKAIGASADDSMRMKELKAQILYRLERYDECYNTYRDIIRSTSDDFEDERKTNMSAVVTNRLLEGSEDASFDVEEATYELQYNGACQLLAKGQVSKALTQLQLAEQNCKQYLMEEDGLTEEEVNEEVAIIKVQQGHCLQLLGREKEATALYNAVLKTKPDDAALVAIINNNLVAINRDGNVFDSKKRMKTAVASGLEHKLTSRQRTSIALNQCLLSYYTNQDELCRSQAKSIATQDDMAPVAIMIEAALLGRDKQLKAAKLLLQEFADDHPIAFLHTKMAATQILLQHGDVIGACEVLESLPESEKYRPGVVGTLVTLYMTQEDKQGASNILRQAVQWHNKVKTSGSLLSDLWRRAADFHLRNGDASVAAASLLELRKLDPKDVKTLAQLINAYAQFDVPAAQSLAKELPATTTVKEGVDVDALEASLGPKYFKKVLLKGEASPASPKTLKTPGEDIKKTKKKKKRKPRMPKDYNPNVEPDPERWLPRWQRKGYRKKKDRRNKDIGKGTQGVSSEAADKFDITKSAGQHGTKSSQVLSPQPESSGPRRNLQKKKAGGKKKKGGW